MINVRDVFKEFYKWTEEGTQYKATKADLLNTLMTTWRELNEEWTDKEKEATDKDLLEVLSFYMDNVYMEEGAK